MSTNFLLCALCAIEQLDLIKKLYVAFEIFETLEQKSLVPVCNYMHTLR